MRIAGTGSLLPGPAVSTAELVRRLDPDRDPAGAVRSTGISTRHFAEPGASSAALAAQALRQAIDASGLAAEVLQRIIFVDSMGGDELMPATSNAVATALGLAGTCDCFDLDNACVGFLSAFDVAARAVATGSGPVGIAIAELWSRHMSKEEPRVYLIGGDVAVAAVVTPARDGEGILATSLRNDGRYRDWVVLANGSVTGRREFLHFGPDNAAMGELAIRMVCQRAREVLDEAGVAMDEVDWVLPHQPNGVLFAAMLEALGVDERRAVPVVGDIGSVSSASLPFSLDRLRRSGRLQPGQLVLMVAVGAGVASGATLLRVD